MVGLGRVVSPLWASSASLIKWEAWTRWPLWCLLAPTVPMPVGHTPVRGRFWAVLSLDGCPDLERSLWEKLIMRWIRHWNDLVTSICRLYPSNLDLQCPRQPARGKPEVCLDPACLTQKAFPSFSRKQWEEKRARVILICFYNSLRCTYSYLEGILARTYFNSII